MKQVSYILEIDGTLFPIPALSDFIKKKHLHQYLDSLGWTLLCQAQCLRDIDIGQPKQDWKNVSTRYSNTFEQEEVTVVITIYWRNSRSFGTALAHRCVGQCQNGRSQICAMVLDQIFTMGFLHLIYHCLPQGLGALGFIPRWRLFGWYNLHLIGYWIDSGLQDCTQDRVPWDLSSIKIQRHTTDRLGWIMKTSVQEKLVAVRCESR